MGFNRSLYSWIMNPLLLGYIAIISSIITFCNIPKGICGIYLPSSISKAEYYLSSNSDSSFFYAKNAESKALEEEDQTLLANSYIILGQLFFKEAAFNQSLEYFLKAENLAESKNEDVLKAKIHNLLGLNYYYLRNKKETLIQHLTALSILAHVNDSLELAKTYGYLGHYYEKNKEYDSASLYQHEALKIYDQLSEHREKVNVLENLGSIFEDLEVYDSAWHYFTKALHLAEIYGQDKASVSVLNNLADVLYKTGRYNESFPYMLKGLAIAKKWDDNYQILSLYRDISQVYYSLKEFELAYVYLDSSALMYKTIYSEEGLRQVSRLQAFYETEKKDREIGILNRDKKIDQLLLFIAFGGIIIITLIGGGLIYRQKLVFRQNKMIYETKQQLMQEQLESRSRSLAAHTLQIIHKNSLLEEIKEEVKIIYQQENKSFKKQLKTLGKKIENNLSQESDWDNFKRVFEEVHTSFFENLRKINPELSKSELKLAVLLKLQLSPSDISPIMSISQDSLRIARYRLKKKLGLKKDQKLSAFIQAL